MVIHQSRQWSWLPCVSISSHLTRMTTVQDCPYPCIPLSPLNTATMITVPVFCTFCFLVLYLVAWKVGQGGEYEWVISGSIVISTHYRANYENGSFEWWCSGFRLPYNNPLVLSRPSAENKFAFSLDNGWNIDSYQWYLAGPLPRSASGGVAPVEKYWRIAYSRSTINCYDRGAYYWNKSSLPTLWGWVAQGN